MGADDIAILRGDIRALSKSMNEYIASSMEWRGRIEARLDNMDRRLSDHMVEEEKLFQKAHLDTQAALSRVDAACKELHENHVTICQGFCADKEERISDLEHIHGR